MKISFFEEYPNAKNLEKLDLINFPTKLYLAEYSIEGYKNYKHQLQKQNKNIKEVIWWPDLNFQEGYWLSPFSKRRGLLRAMYKLQNQDVPILWDAELPMLKISKEQIINKIKELKVKYKENIIIGLGVLTTGMEKNEKILSLENLERDLQICKDSDVNEV